MKSCWKAWTGSWYAFSSKDNLDEALEDNEIFGADTILSSYKVVGDQQKSPVSDDEGCLRGCSQ